MSRSGDRFVGKRAMVGSDRFPSHPGRAANIVERRAGADPDPGLIAQPFSILEEAKIAGKAEGG